MRTRDGRRRRAKGELPAQQRRARARQARYDRIRAAVDAARTSPDGTAWVRVDGLDVCLTHDPARAMTDGYDCHAELIRTKSYGLRLAIVNEHGKGECRLRGVARPIGLRRDQTVAYVSVAMHEGRALPIEDIASVF